MIYFIRHGQSEANQKNIFAKKDAILTPRGIQQVKLVVAKIKGNNIKFDKIFSSDLLRAKQTAELVADGISFDKNEIIFDRRIREYNVGSMANKLETNVDSHQLTHAKGAENPVDFMARINYFLQEIAKIDKDILVVSHAGVYRMIKVIREGLDPNIFYDLEAPKNAEIIKLDI